MNIYRSPKITSYTIQKVAIIPMAQDDATQNGTFYPTNHFLNILEKRFPTRTFFVPIPDNSNAVDSLISDLIGSIEKLKRLDFKIINNSELAYSIIKEKPDAVLIGNFGKLTNDKRYKGRARATLTSCEITYYLVSMKDGGVLCKANALGEEGYYLPKNIEAYPPLDYAISNAIDKIVEKILFN
ncbi:hypothetical protein C0389_04125 [bacterium]|nr:hypothetical protein [bacterium]